MQAKVAVLVMQTILTHFENVCFDLILVVILQGQNIYNASSSPSSAACDFASRYYYTIFLYS